MYSRVEKRRHSRVEQTRIEEINGKLESAQGRVCEDGALAGYRPRRFVARRMPSNRRAGASDTPNYPRSESGVRSEEGTSPTSACEKRGLSYCSKKRGFDQPYLRVHDTRHNQRTTISNSSHTSRDRQGNRACGTRGPFWCSALLRGPDRTYSNPSIVSQ